jgi:hypothetical protein
VPKVGSLIPELTSERDHDYISIEYQKKYEMKCVAALDSQNWSIETGQVLRHSMMIPMSPNVNDRKILLFFFQLQPKVRVFSSVINLANRLF